jgi:hypothetical protein
MKFVEIIYKFVTDMELLSFSPILVVKVDGPTLVITTMNVLRAQNGRGTRTAKKKKNKKTKTFNLSTKAKSMYVKPIACPLH